MTEFRSTSSHPEDLEGGRVIAPGEVIELDVKDQKEPHNQRLINEGALTKLAATKKEDDK